MMCAPLPPSPTLCPLPPPSSYKDMYSDVSCLVTHQYLCCCDSHKMERAGAGCACCSG